MRVLNLWPQCALVLAHMATVARLFDLLEGKELSSLTNTLHLVRPPSLQAPPAKRSGGVRDGPPPPDPASVNWAGARVPSGKSGSWGGHASSAGFAAPSPQTC